MSVVERKNRSLVIKTRLMPRHYALGKSFSTALMAARAVAKKEAAVYAAVFVLPVEKALGYERDIKECLALLFDSYRENDDPWFGSHSPYQNWVGRRAAMLLTGSPSVLFAVEGDDDFCTYQWSITDASIFPDDGYYAASKDKT